VAGGCSAVRNLDPLGTSLLLQRDPRGINEAIHNTEKHFTISEKCPRKVDLKEKGFSAIWAVTL